MAYEEIWQAFDAAFPQFKNAPRSEWQFGVDPDQLATLVISGQKTATSSYYPDYLADHDLVPSVGHLNLILDSKNQAQVITMNTKVVLQAYHQVSEEIANLEGEGSRNLTYWRSVHEPFFQEVAHALRTKFSEDDLIVTEFFEVLQVVHQMSVK